MTDINTKRVESFVEIANVKRGFPLSKETPAEEVLTRLKMLTDGKLCNSALLAFGKDPQYFFHSARIKCAYFLGTRWEKPIEDHKEFEGDVFDQINQAVSFVLSKLNLSVGLREESAQAPMKYEIPRPVILEAIVNAVLCKGLHKSAYVNSLVM